MEILEQATRPLNESEAGVSARLEVDERLRAQDMKKHAALKAYMSEEPVWPLIVVAACLALAGLVTVCAVVAQALGR